MGNLTEALVTIATAIVGVAILSVIVSKKSNTAGVITAGAAAFGNSLGIAVSPVTGASVTGLSGIGSQSSSGFNLPALPSFNMGFAQ